MDFSISRHALRRMFQNDISEVDVGTVLDNPTWNVPTTRGTRYDAMVRGRRLCVVVAEEHSPVRIVTVFWFDAERR